MNFTKHLLISRKQIWGVGSRLFTNKDFTSNKAKWKKGGWPL